MVTQLGHGLLRHFGNANQIINNDRVLLRKAQKTISAPYDPMESARCLLFVFVFIAGLTGCDVSGALRPKMTGDASDVTWAHAVNSRDELDKALASSIDFLEADISLGHVVGNEQSVAIPIMAHPPDTTSDLSLESWLDTVARKKSDKGIKLDFKSIDVVEPSLIILQEYSSKLNSVWLNADVLPGPKGSPATPLPAERFLALCHQYFPNATISIGWTTYLLAMFVDEFLHYEWQHVREMADLIRCHGSEDNVRNYTFPVRGLFASRSIKQLQWLLSVVTNSTLTVWNGKFDPFQLQDVLRIRESFPNTKVFYDLLDRLDPIFQSKKNAVKVPTHDAISDDGLWTTLTKGPGESCSTLTYVRNDVIVFGKSLTTAVLQKNVILLGEKNNLKVTGKVNFFNTHTKPAGELLKGTQKLSIVLAHVNLFSANAPGRSKTPFDLTTSDTEIIWSAINTSTIYTFHHDYGQVETSCRYFKLDTSEDKSFEVWTVPCEEMLQSGNSGEDISKNGIPEISSRKRLVLPEGPFLLGFVSTGDEHVAIHDLKIKYQGDSLVSGSSSKLQSTVGHLSTIASFIALLMLLL